MKIIINIIILLFSLQLSLSAQCYPDRHNTTWFDAWISCDMAPNPNPARETSHWIMYDLGRQYLIKGLHMWNLNVPGRTNQGIKTFAIDISGNGTDWVEAGIFSLDSTEASSIYEGEYIPDFSTVSGQFVLLTVIETWGGSCAGFSELRMQVEPKVVTSVTPQESMKCRPDKNGIRLEWTPPEGENVELQRSMDGLKWQPVGTQVATKDNGKYIWHDTKATNAYYRIKYLNAKSPVYSKVHFCTNAQLTIDVWPNPVKHHGIVKVASISKAPMHLRVQDALGRTIINKQLPTDDYITTMDINLWNLRPGTYSVTVKQGNLISAVKLVKL